MSDWTVEDYHQLRRRRKRLLIFGLIAGASLLLPVHGLVFDLVGVAGLIALFAWIPVYLEERRARNSLPPEVIDERIKGWGDIKD